MKAINNMWKLKTVLILLLLCFSYGSQIREPNCYNCYAYGSSYFYCKLTKLNLGSCCEPGSITSECNYKADQSLSCSAAAMGGNLARGAYCLNNNNSTKCGAQTLMVPDTFKRSLGTIGVGTLKTGTSDSCMWTIQGNKSDFKTGLSLSVN